jgi:hypothetical protein
MVQKFCASWEFLPIIQEPGEKTASHCSSGEPEQKNHEVFRPRDSACVARIARNQNDAGKARA